MEPLVRIPTLRNRDQPPQPGPEPGARPRSLQSTFAGATLSNFLLNRAAGTLIVSLGLVQVAAGMTSLQSGLLALGYLAAILATIRVGEKLLQRFGPKRPMIWGSAIAGVGILLTSMTFTLIGQYIVLAVSAALYVAAQAMDPATIQFWGLFIGNQENVGLRFGGAIGILFNLFMMVVAIIAIMVTVPSERSDKRREVPATPSIGS